MLVSSFNTILLCNYFYREHIFGLHVSQYMKTLEQEDEDAYKRQFSKYIKHGINSEAVSILLFNMYF